jgi:hypothetical protein
MQRNALLVSIGLCVAALILRGWLGVALALVAAAPAGYVAWQGMQDETQKRAASGIAVMVTSFGLAILLAVGRLLHFL